MIDRNRFKGHEQEAMKKRLACQKTTPAKSERIGESFVTWTAFEKSATEQKRSLDVCAIH